MVNGRLARATAPTKREAKQLEAKLTLQLGRRPRARTTTVDDLVAMHLSQTTVSPSRLHDYRLIARTLLPDWLGEIPVTDVGPADVARAYAELAAEGRSAHRIKRLHELLSGAFARAVAWEWIPVSPTTSKFAKPPKAKKAEITPPIVDEVARLLDAAGLSLTTFLLLAATTGARRGELVALQWRDIDWVHAELIVRRAAAYAPGAGVYLNDTKTGEAGHRVLALDPVTMAALNAHRELIEAAANALNAPIGPRSFVFSRTLGKTPWRPDYATRQFGRLRNRLALHHVRLHDLRHFVATRMLAAGEPLINVAGRLGHTDETTTARTYSHFIRGQDRPAVTRLAGEIAAARETRAESD